MISLQQIRLVKNRPDAEVLLLSGFSFRAVLHGAVFTDSQPSSEFASSASAAEMEC